jgi:aspartyl-tRNA(Asn)/glutamyl-tRNA(Gln) amidotransferase subunit A
MRDLRTASITELIAQLSSKQLSPVELMEWTLSRIDATRESLNAVVVVGDREALLADARRAESRYAEGRPRTLEGIPLGVKDLEDVAGMPTSHGSLVFRDAIAERDSVQVARLREAGAIVVGKTNTPEFGYTAITKNLPFGTTRNPWDLNRTPGGSSGGSSAAVAGGVLALTTSSDGGGSIRIPASFTGCFGHKPSFGRVPNEREHWVMGDTSVRGPITRSVEDAATFLDTVVGPHPLDQNALPHPGVSYREILDALPSGLRIGFSPDLGVAVVQGDVAEVVEDAARIFEAEGHQLEPHTAPMPSLGYDWGLMNAFETIGEIASLLPERRDDFGRAFLRGAEAGRRMTPDTWERIRRERQLLSAWCADTFERFDLLLTPTVPYDPPPAGGPFPDETEGRAQPFAGVAAFTIPFNMSWHPAASVRAGLSKAGLPVGLQIVGPRHRDDLVLQAARAFERARPWHSDWPTL